MPNIGITELIIILVILLLLFGSTRLPQLAKGMGKSIREFKKGIAENEPDEDGRELAEARRERLSAADSTRLREEELASEKYADKPR
jgi:sec-independent protein translocase protein TatA